MASGTATQREPLMIGKPLPAAIQAALGRVSEVNSLPEVTTKIVQVVEDPRATAHHMHEIVRTDPALAAKILKVVNSAFYGLPAQIASLDRAILMLGLSAVKNIALAASLARLFRADAISEQFAARDLWHHSVAVGVCARLLAQATPSGDSDEAFVAGLVHDLGLITAQQLFPERMQEIVNGCFDVAQDFCASEERLMGTNHAEIGAALAAMWRFPLALRYAIAHHHTPDVAPVEYQRVTTLVYVADVLCCRGQYGFWLTGRAADPSGEQLGRVGLDANDLARVQEELPNRVTEAEQIFTD